MCKNVLKVITLALVAVMLASATYAIEIPEDATVINGLGRWSPVILVGENYPVPGNPLSNTTVRANGYDSGNYQTITSQYTLDNQAIRFGFIKADSSNFIDGWYYVQFQVTLEDINGDQRGKFTGFFRDICGYVGNRDSSTGIVTDGVYIAKDDNFFSEIRIQDEFLCSVTFGINGTYYSNYNYGGVALNIPHCAPTSIQIKVAMRPITLRSGNAIPNVTEKLTTLNNNVQDLKISVDGVNTTLSSFMTQEAENGRVIQSKLSDVQGAINTSTEQIHNDNQAILTTLNNANQDEYDFIENHSTDGKDDIKNILILEFGDIISNPLIMGNPIKKFAEFITTDDTQTYIHIPQVIVPSIGNNPSFEIIKEQNKDLTEVLESTPIHILILFAKGMFALFFIKWSVTWLDWFMCVIGLRAPTETAVEIDRMTEPKGKKGKTWSS